MLTKTKRTYNLSPEAIAHVRDLAGREDTASSQDGIVELAIERLYRDVRDQDEAARWASAADDPEFASEMRAISASFGDSESWPA